MPSSPPESAPQETRGGDEDRHENADDRGLTQVRQLDGDDPLAPFRQRFRLPEGLIYLDGNSLGPLPRSTSDRLREVVEQEWGEGLIRSWNRAGWIDLSRRVGDGIAELIGAAPGQVIAADSTSVNLFKLLAAAVELQNTAASVEVPGTPSGPLSGRRSEAPGEARVEVPGTPSRRPSPRRVILTSDDNFPTDLYIMQGLARLLGEAVEVRRTSDPAADLSAEVAVLALTHVDYRTGALWDLPALTARAHEVGALTLWDLAHSAGALPLALDRDGVDFAVGCGYKYLNGGPGAPAFLYVAKRHQRRARSPLAGWLGHARPFDFSPQYEPAPGIDRFLCGTPPILSLAALEEGVALAREAPIEEVRRKSMALGDFFLRRIEERCPGLTPVCPLDARRRGSQVAFSHPNAYPVMQALIDRGVIGDFRAPDVLRFGLAPLYLRYEDVWRAVEILREILLTDSWDRPEHHRRNAVT